MKIGPGKYKTRCGKIAIVFTVKAKGSHPIVGVIRHTSADEPASWTEDGMFLAKNKETFWDLDERVGE